MSKANQVISIKLGGVVRTLKYNMNVIALIQEEFALEGFSGMNEFLQKVPIARELIIIIWAGLQWTKKGILQNTNDKDIMFSQDEVGEWDMDEENYKAIIETLSDSLSRLVLSEEKLQEEKKKEAEKAKGVNPENIEEGKKKK